MTDQQEQINDLKADIAAAHQEINKERCRSDALGALVIANAALLAIGVNSWVAVSGSFAVSLAYGAWLWRSCDKPFERLMAEPIND